MNLHNDKAENFLKTLATNSVGASVSDFPYGLKFMGKKWDYELPSEEALSELLRVLKPGGYLLGFGGSRTYHRLVCRLEDVGFEIRDCIMWIYGSGFPKGKACLKPAYEPIIVCRKPGKVIPLNIDECRVASDLPPRKKTFGDAEPTQNSYGKFEKRTDEWQGSEDGRWPANIIIDNEVANGIDEQSGISDARRETRKKLYEKTFGKETVNFGSFGNKERFWDEKRQDWYSYSRQYQDEGGASRYFKQIEWREDERKTPYDYPYPEKDEHDLPIRFQYNGKACPSDRNYGMADGKNTHETVKPIKLMRYLVKLINQPDNPDFNIIDPYMGSGTTGVACELEGIPFIGCEMRECSFDIAKQRIEHARNEYQQKTISLGHNLFSHIGEMPNGTLK